MGFLRRLFGGSDDGRVSPGGDASAADEAEWRVATEASFDATAERQRVTIWLRLYDAGFETTREQLRVFALENEVMRSLDAGGHGEHDTNSLERGFLAMRLVGDDADAITADVLPLLSDVPAGSYLAIRRGPAGTGEDRIEVGVDAGEEA
jgi:hypothetical protein